MKIVLTIHHFPPNYVAGAEVYAYRLASWLVRRGHEVHVVCVESTTFEGGANIACRYELYEDISVWRLYFDRRRAPDPFRQSFDNHLIGEWYTEFLRRIHPDVVHVHSGYLISGSVVAAAKKLSLPLIITLHDFWFVCPRITLLKPTGVIDEAPKEAAECAWCLATEKRRYRWPEIASGGLAGSIARRLLARPWGARTLGIQPDANEIAYRREALMNALQQADVILSPSEFLRNIYIEQGLEPNKIVYTRFGLDISQWAAPAESRPNASDELHLSYIGQVAPHKGVHLLIKAFAQLKFTRRRARLKIYGNLTAFPDYVRSLQHMARNHHAIEFPGWLDNCRVAEVLSCTDAIVVPSIWYENSPIVIMEALATGTPVIGTNLGGIPELVKHDVNGMLFEAGNVKDLARQLQRLLDEPELVPRLAANARPVRLIEDEMKQLMSLYESVLMR